MGLVYNAQQQVLGAPARSVLPQRIRHCTLQASQQTLGNEVQLGRKGNLRQNFRCQDLGTFVAVARQSTNGLTVSEGILKLGNRETAHILLRSLDKGPQYVDHFGGKPA